MPHEGWFCQRDHRTGIVKRRSLDLPAMTICAGGIGDSLAGGYWIEDDMATYYASKNAGGWQANEHYSIDTPAPTIMAEGMAGDSYTHWQLHDDGAPDRPPRDQDKPPYRVPSMAEIAAVPWNGCNVVSLFAGCGGSSLGYRMAGFRVLWASEFVPAACDSYQANKAPHTKIDGRDIRTVAPADILAASGIGSGELDVLDGSPPCQAFSTAGRRAESWGKNRTYEHGARQKNEELFTDYIRILRGLMPRVFVAENVSGLAKGVAKGFFLDILADLKASGYRVASRLLDAQWLGVPQARKRVIFIGARGDLGIDPIFPRPLPYRYSVREACPWIANVRSGLSGFGVGSLTPDRPAPTVLATMQAPYSGHKVECAEVVIRQQQGAFNHIVDQDAPVPTILATQAQQFVLEKAPDKRKFTIIELKRLCAFPDDFVLRGSYAQQWERLGNSVPPLMMRAIAEQILQMLKEKASWPITNQPAAPSPPK